MPKNRSACACCGAPPLALELGDMLETVAEECGETRLLPSDANDPLVFTSTEKAPTRAFSFLKAPTSAFTFKTLC